MSVTVLVAYEVGSLVRLSPAFTDIDGNPADPGTITIRVKNPAGNMSVYTYAAGDITRDGVGLYHLDITVDDDGEWFYRTESTGTVQETNEDSFTVRQSEVI